MVARITTAAFQGIDVVPVDVQVHMASGLPAFTIVGPINKRIAPRLVMPPEQMISYNSNCFRRALSRRHHV